jgi:hypothetical protein
MAGGGIVASLIDFLNITGAEIFYQNIFCGLSSSRRDLENADPEFRNLVPNY